MTPWGVLFLLLSVVGASHASVIAAWKISIEQIAPDHENNDRVRKLDKPPGESAFFQPGDELWDLSRTMEIKEDAEAGLPAGQDFRIVKIEWPGDWAVWNARTGMAVVRGSWNDLYIADKAFGVMETSAVLRTRFELVSGQGAPAKARGISLVSRSGEDATFDLDGMVSHITAWNSGWVCSLQFDVSWPDKDGESRWDITSSRVLQEGERVRLARHGSGDDGWELFGSISKELNDGTLLRESRWIEKDGRIEILKPPVSGKEAIKVSEDLTLKWYPVTTDFLTRLLDEKAAAAVGEIEAPPALHEWVTGKFRDALGALQLNGIKMQAAGSFAGYDPRTSVLVVVATPEDHDFCDKVTASGLICRTSRTMWIESNPESGAWGLACETGTKAGISRKRGEEENLVFKVEPNWGAAAIDLRYTMDLADGSRRLVSATTLYRGVPQVFGSYSSSGEKESQVVITAGDP